MKPSDLMNFMTCRFSILDLLSNVTAQPFIIGLAFGKRSASGIRRTILNLVLWVVLHLEKELKFLLQVSDLLA